MITLSALRILRESLRRAKRRTRWFRRSFLFALALDVAVALYLLSMNMEGI